MTWRMRVVHRTGFEYTSPVVSSYNEARLTPRSDPRQNVILNRVETTPATRAYRYLDYWGTAVTAFDLHAPHTELVVVGSSVVETEPYWIPTDSLSWAELRSEAVVDRFDELLTPTGYVPRNEELSAHAHELAAGLDPVTAVRTIAAWLHDQLSYVSGTTGVHTSAVQAWNERAGVCQDYAHLTLLMLRAVGVPCRYVSGYLHPKRSAELGESVAGQSHAWVEAWTGNWWAIDPTNNTSIFEQHVSVGVGRDYADVPPLKGVFSGGGSKALEVVVDITRLA